MDLAAMRTAVRLRANVPSTDGIWTTAFIDDAINEALVSIGLEHPWPWLENVYEVAGDGTDTYDLTTADPPVRDIKTVHIGGYEGQKASTADIDQWTTYQVENPRFIWAVSNTDLLIKPEPVASQTIRVRYFADEPVLTDTTDEPVMPAVYHPAIVQRASSIGFESLDDQSSAAMHESRARIFIDRMQATALRRVRGPHSIRVRAGHQF